MKTALLVLAALTLSTTALAQQPRPMVEPLRPNEPIDVGVTRPVDLVICLDTSNSMDQLLDSARARVWDIVNELGRMTPTPELRLGLLSYGSPNVATEDEGFVVLRADLSSDLDHVYGELMGLKTEGGDEFVGSVIETAVTRMSWSPDPEGLRLLFVAGNESADQGVERWDFRAAAEAARDGDIIINALYAGSREQAVIEHWPEVARAGKGNFTAIDAQLGTIQIAAPQDQPLLDLNAKLNETYVPYGESGAAGLANQVTQDNNASRLGVQSCSSRIVAKGGALYDNSSWDLVDAAAQEDFQWGALRDQDLPEELRSMTRSERIAYVDSRRTQREEIQSRIQLLSEQREAFHQAERRKQVAELGLDDAMRDALISQAKGKGFACGGC